MDSEEEVEIDSVDNIVNNIELDLIDITNKQKEINDKLDDFSDKYIYYSNILNIIKLDDIKLDDNIKKHNKKYDNFKISLVHNIIKKYVVIIVIILNYYIDNILTSNIYSKYNFHYNRLIEKKEIDRGKLVKIYPSKKSNRSYSIYKDNDISLYIRKFKDFDKYFDVSRESNKKRIDCIYNPYINDFFTEYNMYYLNYVNQIHSMYNFKDYIYDIHNELLQKLNDFISIDIYDNNNEDHTNLIRNIYLKIIFINILNYIFESTRIFNKFYHKFKSMINNSENNSENNSKILFDIIENYFYFLDKNNIKDKLLNYINNKSELIKCLSDKNECDNINKNDIYSFIILFIEFYNSRPYLTNTEIKEDILLNYLKIIKEDDKIIPDLDNNFDNFINIFNDGFQEENKLIKKNKFKYDNIITKDLDKLQKFYKSIKLFDITVKIRDILFEIIKDNDIDQKTFQIHKENIKKIVEESTIDFEQKFDSDFTKYKLEFENELKNENKSFNYLYNRITKSLDNIKLHNKDKSIIQKLKSKTVSLDELDKVIEKSKLIKKQSSDYIDDLKQQPCSENLLQTGGTNLSYNIYNITETDFENSLTL